MELCPQDSAASEQTDEVAEPVDANPAVISFAEPADLNPGEIKENNVSELTPAVPKDKAEKARVEENLERGEDDKNETVNNIFVQEAVEDLKEISRSTSWAASGLIAGSLSITLELSLSVSNL